MAKFGTDAKFRGVKATPKNAIKHQRAGQKRYTKSAQKRANRELQEQKEKYSNRVEWGANTFGNFMYSANKRETNH